MKDNATRDERRWAEKQNKAAKKKQKKEEIARMMRLVDNCKNSDPRMKMYKKEDKQAKADKQVGQTAIRFLNFASRACMR